MDAIKEIAITQPRENSGSDTSLRFEYQKNWGLKKLLELEQSGEEYSIAFDYHDDIIVFNNEREATKVDFYQVKTKKNGSWTISNIYDPNVKSDETEETFELTSEGTKDTKGKDAPKVKNAMRLSYLAKLLSHTLQITTASNFFFVTNRQFTQYGFLRSGSKQLSFDDITPDFQVKIKTALAREVKGLDISHVKNFYILQDQLPLDTCSQTMRTIVRDFLNEKIPHAEIDSDVFYETLLNQIIRRRNDFSEDISDPDVFVEKKCFAKSQFSALISKLVNLESFNSRCHTIETWLSNVKPYEAEKIRIGLREIRDDIMEYGNMSISRLLNSTRDILSNNGPTEADNTYLDYATRIADLLKEKNTEAKSYSDNYLIALALYGKTRI